MENEQPSSYASGRVAFFAQRTLIQERVNQGVPLSAIYREAAPHLAGISYSMFTRHVAKYITKPEPIKPQATATPVKEPIKPPPPMPRPVFQKGNRVPNPDDLI